MSFRFFSTLLLAAAFLATADRAQAAPPKPKPGPPKALQIEPKDGDMFVFIGDSITGQSLYTQYIEDFYYTRFPNLRVHFHNAGTAGDRVKDVMERFDEDVVPHKPTYVSVLLGMNDGNFSELQPATFEAYQADMSALLDRIAKLGATAIAITPTIWDPTSARLHQRTQDPRDKVYNEVMATYGTWLKEQAKLRKLALVDVYTLLNKVTVNMRKADPDWTLMPDGAHPSPAGHAMMATEFLNEVSVLPPISEIAILKKDGQWTGDGGTGELKDLQEGAGPTFTFTAKALPWALPPEAEDGLRIANMGAILNRETLTVSGLQPGNYELKIDGAAVGRWSEKELAAGVEFGENAQTPQFQQAREVAELNKKRTAKSVYPLRVSWAQLKDQRGIIRAAQAANEKPAQIEQKQKQFDRFDEEFKKQVEDYRTKREDWENQIYEANQPKPRKYEIVRVE